MEARSPHGILAQKCSLHAACLFIADHALGKLLTSHRAHSAWPNNLWCCNVAGSAHSMVELGQRHERSDKRQEPCMVKSHAV